MAQDKTITLRELFHDLGNKHQVALLGAGITAENLGDMLKSQGLSLEDKETLKKTIDGLSRIEKASQEADILMDEIKRLVYERLNSDEIKVEKIDFESRLLESQDKKMLF